jgi:hypothetical protein
MIGMRRGVLAIGLLTAWTLSIGTAAADCSAPRSLWAEPVLNGTLPVTAASSEREIARFALPYADLVSYLRPPEKRDLSPPGYVRGLDSTEWFRAYDPGAAAWAALTSFYAATFFHCTTRTMVIAFESINPFDPRDLVVSFSRQIFGGWSPFALRFAEAVRAAYPDYEITLAGHSGGGGLASYVGGQLGLPVIAFAPARNTAATSHTTDRQLNVSVIGDPIADPNALSVRPFRGPRVVPGLTLMLSVEVTHFIREIHALATVIRGLEALQ